MLKRKRTSTVCLAVLTIAGFMSFSSPAASQERTVYFTAALDAARWLTSLEQRGSGDTLSWPMSDISSWPWWGISSGSAGIGLFFLRLHQATGAPEDLARAIGAANHEAAAGFENGPDWLSGAAGSGHFFLEVYRVTQDPVQLARAESAAAWLMAHAKSDKGGFYWTFTTTPKIFTGMAHGAAGIGDFLVELYQVTGNPVYLQHAEGAYRWIMAYMVPLGADGIGLKRLTTDSEVYHLWCGGSTGAIFFFERLHAATRQPEYLDSLKRLAAGLVRSAHPRTEGGHAWSYTTSGGAPPVVYCHGAASVAHALYRAFLVTGETRYLEEARQALAFVIAIRKERAPGRYYWPHILGTEIFENGYMWGTASVGRAFLEAIKLDPTPDPLYLTMARGAADDLLDVSERPAGDQRRWTNYNSPIPPGEAQARETGWFRGAAGIGMFLLDLDQLAAASN